MQRLFVYGTLAPGRPNAHVLEEIGGSWQSASVWGRLHQAGWGAELGYPGMTLDEAGEEIKGFLFSSDNLLNHWERLDEFEGEDYERIATLAKVDDGSSAETFVYVLKRK
ncbi:MAG: gamma-glutamylcyclotransferase [Cyanobacteria bacterium J06626_14]